MTIFIKNLHDGMDQPGVYIGRGAPGAEQSPMLGGYSSPLANPFTIREVGGRVAALVLYDKWLKEKIAAKDRDVCGELARLQAYAKTQDLTLLCWCAPKCCHGDIIRQTLETQDFSEYL